MPPLIHLFSHSLASHRWFSGRLADLDLKVLAKSTVTKCKVSFVNDDGKVEGKTMGESKYCFFRLTLDVSGDADEHRFEQPQVSYADAAVDSVQKPTTSL